MSNAAPARVPRAADLAGSDRIVALTVFAVACLYFAAFDPLSRPLLLDSATWDYMAVELPNGLVPYRDVFLHKTPGTAFVGAIAAWLAGFVGAEPVLAVHLSILAQGALAPALLYLLCRPSLGRTSALAAAFALLAYDQWVVAVLEGSQPKVPTVVFGLAGMLAAERGRAISAGLWGGIGVLCWQPALAFLLGSLARLLHGEVTWAARLRVTLLLGTASLAPSAILLLWLGYQGAFQAFVDQAILFNVDYIRLKARTLWGTLRAIGINLGDWEDLEMLMAPVAALGLLFGRPRLPVTLLVSGIVYAGMLFVSMQSWPDLILLGPVLAALFGAGVHALLSLRLAAPAAAALTLAVITMGALPDNRPKYHPGLDFHGQRTRMRELAEELAPGDVVVGVSVPEFFLQTGLQNGWMWPYLWFGVDSFAAAHTPGGFDGFLRDLERKNPRMIILGRHWSSALRGRFEAWAASRYTVSEVRVFPHVQRPMRVYRRRA